MDPAAVAEKLSRTVRALHFSPPITHVYNPLEYAWAPHRLYLQRYGQGAREILLVGMNPGPFGMAQTGVPFGDVSMVRDWLRIEAPVNRPELEHPKRPVTGFQCSRGEVSGQRLWGWARDRFGAPEKFFRKFFVINYCPLCFMESSGRNFTPDKLPALERTSLLDACDKALRDLAAYYSPQWILGVGDFAERRIRAAFPGFTGVIGRIPHPSPASPAANRGWSTAAEAALRAFGIRV
ncbi:MAG TPA: single-stranded DNA-binding protein [Candidatus Hydrogenedentes bacterium]|nr:single-stranded DNA-binding protein [Candidatus Hydrogenedentota bacterium]